MTPTRVVARGRSGGSLATSGKHAGRRPGVLVYAAAAVLAAALAAAGMRAGYAAVAAVLHFLLRYGGVFALVCLTASVGFGLVATDRIIMSPGNRVLAQAVHRAVSFGALAFLVIHITLEVIAPRLPEAPAQHLHIIDAFVPFLSQYRTFYMGLGTIASDLIVLVVATSIVRRRYTARGSVRTWRAIHYTTYAAFVLGVAHGLLAGRPAKPYVDWSYGLAIALTALGVVVRYIAASLRSKESGAAAQASVHSGPLPRLGGMVPGSVHSGPLPQVGGTVPGSVHSGPLPRLGGPVPPSVISGPLPRVGDMGRNPPAIQNQDPQAAMVAPPAYLPGYDATPPYEPSYAGLPLHERDHGGLSLHEQDYAGPPSYQPRHGGPPSYNEPGYAGPPPYERDYAEPPAYEPGYAGPPWRMGSPGSRDGDQWR